MNSLPFRTHGLQIFSWLCLKVHLSRHSNVIFSSNVILPYYFKRIVCGVWDSCIPCFTFICMQKCFSRNLVRYYTSLILYGKWNDSLICPNNTSALKYVMIIWYNNCDSKSSNVSNKFIPSRTYGTNIRKEIINVPLTIF